jgi:hypothetical protein
VKFGFIAKHRGVWPANWMCEALGVSRGGFYAWLTRPRMASSVGGYLAARLRTKWIGVHTNEVFFRDAAHGLIAWALATLLSAGILSAVTTHIASGAAQGAVAAAPRAPQNANPSDIYVDRLFRADLATPLAAGAQPTPGNADTSRAEGRAAVDGELP